MEPSLPFLQVLQSCITPIALISGVGLLLISLTNRLGRTIDAIRKIVREIDESQGIVRERKIAQMKIIYKRSKLLRNGISSMAFSILNSSLIIFVLLISLLCEKDLHNVAVMLLFFSITGIIGSAIFLFSDVILTLNAISYEVKDHLD
ncbi:MAG: DUF2721 domain-containing protein [Candidatus Marinimicrobia bacterium]|nr:DUF2721 domain-containing protein [Candidatus Neomarinimicrobiota bacterium]